MAIKRRFRTKPMNEWGFIGHGTLVALGKSATFNKFKQRCGLVIEERTMSLIPTHHSQALCVSQQGIETHAFTHISLSKCGSPVFRVS